MVENDAAQKITKSGQLPMKTRIVKLTRLRSKRNQCHHSSKADIQPNLTIQTSLGFSSRADIAGDQARSAITSNSIERSNDRFFSAIQNQTSRSALTYSHSGRRQGKKNVLKATSTFPLQRMDREKNNSAQQENDNKSILTITDLQIAQNGRIPTNNGSHLGMINSRATQIHYPVELTEDFGKKNKKRRKTASEFCRCSQLCIFCSILGFMLLSAIIAAAVVSALTIANKTTKMSTTTTTPTTTTTATTTTTTRTTTTTTVTTTTTTETTTITYVPTGIYALQIPSCATWDQNGITVAGNANGASGSGLGSLRTTVSIFIDNNYTLYVCDRDNDRIMKYEVNATTGTVVAGTGSPGNGSTELNSPRGVAVDQMGAIIVADTLNYRIQRFPLGSLIGTTVAMNSSANLLGQMRDLHIDVNNGIYVTDSDYSRIVKYYPNNGIGVILAGSSGPGSAADQLLQPFGNFMDGNQTLYIADYGNHRIQKWPAGATSGITVAGVTGSSGSGLGRLNNPISVAVDNNGYVYIADHRNHRIVRWTDNYAAGGTCIVGCTGVSGVAATQLFNPRDVKFDASGNIYVSDQGNNRVQKFLIQISPNCTNSTSSG